MIEKKNKFSDRTLKLRRLFELALETFMRYPIKTYILIYRTFFIPSSFSAFKFVCDRGDVHTAGSTVMSRRAFLGFKFFNRPSSVLD